MANDQNGVIRFSARNPGPKCVCKTEDSMLIDEIDWKWDEKIKDLVPYVKGQVDLQEVTDSYKDTAGTKNILAMIARGDYSMVHSPVNLGDTTGFPDNIHDVKKITDAAEQAASGLDGLKLKDADGQIINGVKLSQLEAEEITKIVQSYLDGKTEGAKQDEKHE